VLDIPGVASTAFVVLFAIILYKEERILSNFEEEIDCYFLKNLLRIMKTKLLPLVLLLSALVLSCSQDESTQEIEDSQYPIAQVETRLGSMFFWLYDETPVHKAKFIELATAGLYDQFTFNRIVKKFVVQGGCPDSVQYFEDSPYLLDPEFMDSLKHDYGALGMGRDDNPEKQSNACQFYIVNEESGLPNLDGDYVIFGKLIKGFDVLELLEKEVTVRSQPLEDIPLKVRIQKLTENELLAKYDFKL
jgi:peptidyl-prolyl cis-trans isomerase B (cyclophilin B)